MIRIEHISKKFKKLKAIVKPANGRIFIDGELINGDPSYRKKIGYMPQIGRYPDNMKVGQLFSMMKNIRNAEENNLDNDLIIKFNLVSIFDKPMRTLSGGTRQKVSAALAFYFLPDILILDEPTAGLDPLSSEILKEKIIAEKKRNKLILITSHVLSELDELTTQIMYLQEGKLQFFKNIETLQEETGELKLGKAIAQIMRQGSDSNWISELFEAKNPRP